MRRLVLIFMLVMHVHAIACMGQAFRDQLLFETVSIKGINLTARVYTLVQDPYGFIWLGTDYGLMRYDGYRTLRIQLPDTDHTILLGTAGIESLSLGNDTSLWVGTSHGVVNFCLKSYISRMPEQLIDHHIRSMLFQNDTVLWIGTHQGLYKYNPETDRTVIYNTRNSQLTQNRVRALYLDRSENLWAGTADKLNVLHAGSNVFESYDLKADYKPDIRHSLILDIKPYAKDNDSLLLIGTETGLYLLNRFSDKYRVYNEGIGDLPNEVVKSIYVKDPSEIFLGTDRGLFTIDLKNGSVNEYYHNPYNNYSITNNEIWKILPDHQGNLWLGTSNGISRLSINLELFRYYPVYFSSQDGRIGTRVADVLFDRNDNLWIATANGLLFSPVQSGDRKVFTNITGNVPFSISNINTIATDNYDRIWIGSVAGINIWDPEKEINFIPRMDAGTSTKVASNYISTIIREHDFFWIGTWGGGLYRTRADEENTESVTIHYIADFNGQMVAGKDHLWALHENTISSFNLNTEKVEVIPGLSRFAENNPISSICYSRKNLLWLGSNNKLIKYEIDNAIYELIHLPIDKDFIIEGVIEDDKGIIWGSSQNTVFRFDPAREEFKYFPVPPKFPIKKFILSPFRKSSDGDIMVCGFDGFLKFSPDDLMLSENEHSVLITSLIVNGETVFPYMEITGVKAMEQTISNSQEVVLSYKNRDIIMELSSFRYGEIEQEQYSCILEGYEDSWRFTEPGTNRIEYMNLPSGRYVFKAKNLIGPSDNLTNLTIKIRPPLWANPFILAVYFLILSGISAFIIYQYHSRMKYKARMDLIQVEKKQTESLIASKNRFLINISHELLTSISLIIDPIKNLISRQEFNDQVRDTLKLIDRNAHFLKVYIDQLLNFRKIETGQSLRRLDNKLELVPFCKDILALFETRALSRGVILVLKANIEILVIETDEEKLHSILQNLLSNAIDFTPHGGKVVVSLKLVSTSEVLIEVKDNGIGIPKEKHEKVFDRFYQVPHKDFATRGTGIGLTIVKDFVGVLNGRIELDSEVNAGTAVRVFLPVYIEGIKTRKEEVFVTEFVSTEAIREIRDSSADWIHNDAHRPEVLVVDENKDLFEYIRSSLRNEFHTIWAPNGRKALDLINEHIPTIIVSEIQIPDTDGITLCRKIRGNPKTARIPLILLTAVTEVESQLEAIEAGVDVFLAKPFEIEVLKANITNLIRRIEKTEEFITQRLLMNAQQIEVDSKDDRLLKEVVKYIHKNMTNSNITAREISYSVGVSHSNLYRKIKNITGLSLNEFVRYIRLQKAEKLLSTGKFSVSEVMFQVGFTNHSYFSKCFKKLYRLTPKEFAKS